MKLLIIEDDKDVLDTITLLVQMRWPEVIVSSATNGRRGIDLLSAETPDLILLDLLLPDISGFEIIKQIRSFSDVAIIIISVMGNETNISRGLEFGADDYVVKPFGELELLSRIQAVLRRTSDPIIRGSIVRGPFTYSPSMSSLIYKGKNIFFTRTEGLMLYELMKNEEIVLSNTYLSELIWGDSCIGSDENIRVHINRLRKKIEADPKNPKIILTKIGQGYYFSAPK